MKKLFFLISILFSLSSFNSFTFTSISEIVNALKSGNSSQLAQFFDNSIDISIGGDPRTYSKKQAEQVVNTFFKENPVNNFVVIHKSENGNAQFVIGNLTTKNGNFRTTVYVKIKDKTLVIQEIQFEK
ncbi:MAG: DUF4783 domain-containing protein [Ginsengibacter sp.]|jgi:hypothetical protein